MGSVTALLTALTLLLPVTGSIATISAVSPGAAVVANGSWPEYHHDDGHTGYDPSQPSLTGVTTGWVSPTLDGQVYAEPLVANGLVFVATLNNSVYALDQSTGAVIWHDMLGAPQTTGWGCGNVSPQGIVGTPVIDTAAGRIYVAAFFSSDTYRVMGLALSDGSVQMSTTLNMPGFDWRIEQERAALALHGGYVYVAFGGRAGDCGTYHGYVVAVPTNGAANLPPYQTPGIGSGIWNAGGPVVDDATGDVFAATGNGTGSGCSSANQNDAVIRLSSTTVFQDYFMPQDWQADWCANDQDLGSAGPILISPSVMFQAGKHGSGFLLNPNSLGGVDGQVFPTPRPQGYAEAQVCQGNTADATFGSFAYAAPYVYMECDGNGLVALNLNTAAPSFPACASAPCAAPDWQSGGSTTFGPPIVAGGAVWAVDTGGTTGLYAFSSATGALLFHSAGFSGTNHFETPSEGGGQVFVSSGALIRSFNMTFGVTITPSTLDFNGQSPGALSAPQTVTLHNNQAASLTVTSASLAGANPTSYVKGTDTCSGTTVPPNGTCTVQVSFAPSALGGFPASLSFSDTAASSPQTVALHGLGAVDNQSHLYTLDYWGGLHGAGSAPTLATTAYWPGWNIARGAALFPNGLGGYVLDGWGGVHAVGSAPPATGFAYWPGWDIARGIAMAPWSSSSAPAGWTLDGWGGIHPFGGAPALGGFAYWPGWDIARGLVILPDSTPGSVAGYTMDGWGGLHPFGGAPALSNYQYWPGWDIARGITLSPNASRSNPAGWTLDGWGGVHPFGNAPAQSASAYWPGWDIARGIVAWTGGGTGGWVMDGWGGLHTFGSAPVITSFAYWPGWYIAGSLAGPDFSSGGTRHK